MKMFSTARLLNEDRMRIRPRLFSIFGLFSLCVGGILILFSVVLLLGDRKQNPVILSEVFMVGLVVAVLGFFSLVDRIIIDRRRRKVYKTVTSEFGKGRYLERVDVVRSHYITIISADGQLCGKTEYSAVLESKEPNTAFELYSSYSYNKTCEVAASVSEFLKVPFNQSS